MDRAPAPIDRSLAAALLCAALATLLAPPFVAEGEMQVSDSGVGRSVVDRELRDRGDRFDEGSDVWFWTRVTGGSGQTLRHVWLREGREIHVQELRIGSDDWRTWSKKTLHPGSLGEWAVEARDAEGRVLARSELRCTEATGQEQEETAG